MVALVYSRCNDGAKRDADGRSIQLIRRISCAIALRLAPLSTSVAGNLFSIGGGALVSRLLSFAMMLIIARRVGAAGFGLLNFGVAIAAFAAILVGPGFLLWGVRAIAEEPSKAGEYLVLINSVQLLLACASYALLALVLSVGFHHAERQIGLAYGLTIFSLAISVEWVGQGLEQFRLVAAAQIVTSAVLFVAVILTVKSSQQLLYVPLWTASAQVVGALLVLAGLARRDLLHVPRTDFRSWPRVMRQSLPLGLSVAMITILHYVNTIVLQLLRGSEEVGFFSAALRLWEILSAVPGLVSTVFLPRIARIRRTDKESAMEGIRWYVRIIMALAFFPAIVYITDADSVIRLLFSPQYARAAALLRPLGIAVIFNFGAIAYITILLTHSEDRAYMRSILAGLIVAMTGAITLVPTLGAWGATLSIAAIDLATWLTTLPALRRILRSSLLREWIRPLVSGALLATWLVASRGFVIPFAVRVAVGALGYGAIAFPWAAFYRYALQARISEG